MLVRLDVLTFFAAAGAIVVEWNVKQPSGQNAGAGMWDSHIRLGGSECSSCSDPLVAHYCGSIQLLEPAFRRPSAQKLPLGMPIAYLRSLLFI